MAVTGTTEVPQEEQNSANLLDKFPRRRDGFYTLPPKSDGTQRRYISVTKVLECLAKPSLIPWAARTAASLVLNDPQKYSTGESAAAAIYGIKGKAGDRGSMVHSFIESVLKGNSVPDEIPDHVHGYWTAFQSWAAAVKPVPIHSEVTVFSDRWQFAGTMDLVAAIDGRVILADFKTSSMIPPEAAIQMAAYRSSDYIWPRGKDTALIPMMPVAETWVVRLCGDGTYEHKSVHADIDVFLALKRVWEWQHGRA